jgi:predicted nucleic acid-binding protein
MPIVIDTTVIIACVMNEPHRDILLDLTADQELVAPASLPWEIGNAFSSMFKQRRISVNEAVGALELYRQMLVRLVDVDLEATIRLSDRLHIYAYDAYMIQCALESDGQLLTLDRGLKTAARAAGIILTEVRP